ncbi:MAG TPA: hypothetical protein DD706_12115 [Nitrospiraceae bacterium]|nr:hypothetical protein [Nitrospiraceae bacterium]
MFQFWRTLWNWGKMVMTMSLRESSLQASRCAPYGTHQCKEGQRDLQKTLMVKVRVTNVWRMMD